MNDSQVLTINLGPQHPSTHGVLRVLLDLDGETVVDARPDVGFLHRGIEKIAENRLYHQIIPLTDRLDYLAAMSNNLAYVLTVEKLFDLEVPRRARYVRVILAELQRIASHLFWLGTHAHDLGAMSPMFYALREREEIMDIFDAVAGSRLTPSYLRFGGLYADIDGGFVRNTTRFVSQFGNRVDEYEELLTENPIWKSRTKGVGIMSAEECTAMGISGPLARGSGLARDLRKSSPYSSYEEFQFEIPLGFQGDVYDRYMVRIGEMRQSVEIIVQALEGLPEGPHSVVDAPTTFPEKKNLTTNLGHLIRHFNLVVEGVRPPAAEVYHAVESPRGELGFYIVSDGTGTPSRLKVRAPSFANLQGLAHMCRGRLLSDAVAIIGMIDIVLAEVDR
ncbi:MAG: NADH dehydrogenase (quinone) subunit D [Syntrophales bacterium]|jgi:NADH-quinone oxidoreductase subunit D|nr:NADH dehydrogenase (quinone) subunit D [Syntrophales bacterium]MCK9527228.1 NADH dehydrogenase (quinone) subunit D [Syntrophales bacterium]MDX9921302.1 NADH dehydrogenase (quinone) subunit D [Syntrophales bacterium]